MGEEQAILAAIKADPAADLPRLVLADWLDEHDDSDRAELIRAQVEAARLPREDARWAALWARILEILAVHKHRWLGPWVGHGWFDRGLIHIWCRGAEVFAGTAADDAPAWVERVRLFGTAAAVLPALATPWFDRVAFLGIEGDAFGRAGAAGLASSPGFAHLTDIDLRYNRIGNLGLGALATSVYPARLTTLDLSDNDVQSAGVLVLVQSPLLDRLTTLGLGDNHIGDAGATALAEYPSLAPLTTLNLRHTGIGSAGAEALAASPHLTGLTTLDLRGNRIGKPAAARLRARFGASVWL